GKTWQLGRPSGSVQRRVSEILSLKLVLKKVRLLTIPFWLSQTMPSSWLRLFSGFIFGLPTITAGTPPPPPVIWPQSATAERREGALKPEETPPFNVNCSVACQTP